MKCVVCKLESFWLKLPVCYRCNKPRFVEDTFTCPLCQGTKTLTRDYTFLLGQQVCSRCAHTFHDLERFAARGHTRAQHLLDIATLILRPIYKQDRSIPVTVLYAQSTWGNRWVGPPALNGDWFGEKA